jgi:hypothetical protein
MNSPRWLSKLLSTSGTRTRDPAQLAKLMIPEYENRLRNSSAASNVSPPLCDSISTVGFFSRHNLAPFAAELKTEFMCGIAGIYAYHYAANPVDRAELRKIRDHMAARGPDGSGEWYSSDERVGFGHRRLTIIDLSERGAQRRQARRHLQRRNLQLPPIAGLA